MNKEMNDFSALMEKARKGHEQKARKLLGVMFSITVSILLILALIIAAALLNKIYAQGKDTARRYTFSLINISGSDLFSIKNNHTASNNKNLLKDTIAGQPLVTLPATLRLELTGNNNTGLDKPIEHLAKAIDSLKIPQPGKPAYAVTPGRPVIIRDTGVQVTVHNDIPVTVVSPRSVPQPMPGTACTSYKYTTLVCTCAGLFTIIAGYVLLLLGRMYRYNIKMAAFYEHRSMAFALAGAKEETAVKDMLKKLSLHDALAITSTAGIDLSVPKNPKDELIELFKTFGNDAGESRKEGKGKCCCPCCKC